MRKLLGWLVVTLGIAALVRKLRRREPELAPEPTTSTTATAPPVHTPSTPSEAPPATEPAPAAEPTPTAEPPTETGDDPAAELREKLARSRADIPSSEEPSPEERRASVYEQGRAALDEMQPAAEPPAEHTGEPTEER